MPSYHVKLRGASRFIHLEAATFEETANPENPSGLRNRIAKDANGKEVAWFDGREIAGWWIEPEKTDLADAIERARLKLARSQSTPEDSL
jgi:hypothetical protein